MTTFPAWPSSVDGLVELYPRNTRPTLRLNFIASADGAVTVDGLSAGLQGPGDKEIFDALRMVCDALIVAAGTVRAENYDALRLTREAREWRVTHGLPEFPLMVVVSASLRLDPEQLIFSDAPVRPIVFTCRTAPGATEPGARTGVIGPAARLAKVAEVVTLGEDRVDLPATVAFLNDRGATQLLCEGGPTLTGGLIAADLVDELCLTVSPLLVGGSPGRVASGPPAQPRRMTLRHALSRQDMLFLRYARSTAHTPSP